MVKEALSYRFDDFLLDVANRQLWQGETRLDLNGRYFDALALLVREHGQLVGKDQFFNEVWGDVVVGDAALTQCIKSIRKQLGDAVANPRYIETVPRYGYRFVGTVTAASSGEVEAAPPPFDSQTESGEAGRERRAVPLSLDRKLRKALVLGSAGTFGGGVAGMLGGLLYGLALAYAPSSPRLGTASLLLVLISLNVAVGAVGGFGVGFGMAAAALARRPRPWWSIAGAALGGVLVGGLAKLLGVDAFTLLFGRAPAGITGGMEGAVLGAALALGTQLGGGLDPPRRWRPVVGAGLAGLGAGVLIPLAGGRLMGGSLELLAHSFASSRLDLGTLGRFFGEVHFGATTQIVSSGIEGFLFGSGVVGAIVLAQRMWSTRT